MRHARRLLAALTASFLAWSGVAAAQAPQNTLATIKQRGKIIAGVKFDTPPFGFLDENNQPTGFDLDLVHKIADRLGVGVEFVKVTSPTRIPLLVSGNVDLVAASMTRTPEREKTIDFSITYYTGGQSLLVPADSKITGIKDLDGKEVAVQQGTTLEKNIAAVAPSAKVIAFKDYNSAWLALAQGRVDALTGSLNILQGFQKNNPKFKIVGEMFSVEPFGIGFRKGDTELRDAVDAALKDLWTSGAYSSLYRKYFGTDPAVPIETRP
ncbi:MAG: transporter substrate-binding domain-containing protein [Hyphomicrobiales bacterium]|nr:transporter substrate-binding domain-containing protein [Hyphomicrobiales bacterium]MBV8769062.1 transporter substrate-binding domain-containing protein [Hyphomicrobiales bacterium]MBV9051397.1 transporter substrate-binding domain-containing protein [Hyphomicrobiales bacterium]MBV9591167.1 transporter substrate-binding domain-containing protein [Hyphomicrobiales bacterium]